MPAMQRIIKSWGQTRTRPTIFLANPRHASEERQLFEIQASQGAHFFSSAFFDAASKSGEHSDATTDPSTGSDLEMASTSHQENLGSVDDIAAHADEHHTETTSDAPDGDAPVLHNAAETIPVAAPVTVPQDLLPAVDQGTLHILVAGYKRRSILECGAAPNITRAVHVASALPTWHHQVPSRSWQRKCSWSPRLGAPRC